MYQTWFQTTIGRKILITIFSKFGAFMPIVKFVEAMFPAKFVVERQSGSPLVGLVNSFFSICCFLSIRMENFPFTFMSWCFQLQRLTSKASFAGI